MHCVGLANDLTHFDHHRVDMYVYELCYTQYELCNSSLWLSRGRGYQSINPV